MATENGIGFKEYTLPKKMATKNEIGFKEYTFRKKMATENGIGLKEYTLRRKIATENGIGFNPISHGVFLDNTHMGGGADSDLKFGMLK